MALHIRIADFEDPDDARAMVEVLDSYARDPMGGGTPLRAEVRETLPAKLAEQGNAVVFLAFDGEEPVGVANCFRVFSTFAAKPLLNIHDLAVVPTHRGKGIGREMLTAIQAEAEQSGYCKLTLEVREDNVGARHLYESFGFGDFAPGSEPVATIFLEKKLTSRG